MASVVQNNATQGRMAAQLARGASHDQATIAGMYVRMDAHLYVHLQAAHASLQSWTGSIIGATTNSRLSPSRWPPTAAPPPPRQHRVPRRHPPHSELCRDHTVALKERSSIPDLSITIQAVRSPCATGQSSLFSSPCTMTV